MSKAASLSPRAITGKHVLIGLLSFFGVVISVNMAFVYFALDSWTGLVAQDSYRKGLAYNDTLADAERQAALGWKTAVGYDGTALTIRLIDENGNALLASDITVVVRRPTHENMDLTVTMEAADNGYVAPVTFPEAGLWDVDVTIDRGADRYRMIHRLVVAP